jgi:alkylation response protein AidB-like acyl-CoA dehydrogenase
VTVHAYKRLYPLGSAMPESTVTASTLSRPTREQILESARMMVPVLRERALKAERDRLIPVDTHRAFQEAGFYKLFQPGRYGGYEMPIGMMVEVASELGRGCGSSTWIFTNLAVQNWIIGMHQPQAQEEMWGNNPDALAASSFPTPRRHRPLRRGRARARFGI